MTMTPTVLATRSTGVADRHENEHDPAARPRRRTFTSEKKLALLAEYDAADREGRGALLRREAIYSSHISEWRKQRDRGTMAPYEFEKNPEFPGTGDWGCPAHHFSVVDGRVVVSGGSHMYEGPGADVVVRVVTSEQDSWIGYFASGMGGATTVIPSPDPGQLLVVASGEPYLVPALRPEAATLASRGMPIRTIVPLRSDRVLLASDLGITALGSSGVEWTTEPLCLDDLTIGRVDDGPIHCTGYFGESGEYGHDAIVLSAETGEQVGG